MLDKIELYYKENLTTVKIIDEITHNSWITKFRFVPIMVCIVMILLTIKLAVTNTKTENENQICIILIMTIILFFLICIDFFITNSHIKRYDENYNSTYMFWGLDNEFLSNYATKKFQDYLESQNMLQIDILIRIENSIKDLIKETKINYFSILSVIGLILLPLWSAIIDKFFAQSNEITNILILEIVILASILFFLVTSIRSYLKNLGIFHRKEKILLYTSNIILNLMIKEKFKL